MFLLACLACNSGGSCPTSPPGIKALNVRFQVCAKRSLVFLPLYPILDSASSPLCSHRTRTDRTPSLHRHELLLLRKRRPTHKSWRPRRGKSTRGLLPTHVRHCGLLQNRQYHRRQVKGLRMKSVRYLEGQRELRHLF